MANTLTGLIPVLYKGLDIVLRELVGFIPNISLDASGEAANIGEVVRTYTTPAATTGDIVAGQLPPDDGDQTLGTVDMAITKSKYSPIRWNGEEVLGYRNTGRYEETMANQFAQSIRALVNLVEIDLAALYATASRAYGTAGTTPFATAADLSDIAQVRKILEDNGAPRSNLALVIGTAEAANLRGKQSQLFRVNEAGTDNLLRRGYIDDLQGFSLGVSAARAQVTKGTGTLYTSTAAGFAVGTTSIPLITGSGTVLAGDVVTFAGDTNKYVVATGVAAPGTIVLAAPGLRQALPASAVAMTIGNSFAANMAFEKDAIRLLTRAPAMPVEGDDADDVTYITDPISGLTFQVAQYRLYRRVKYEVGLAWGVKTIKPELITTLLG